MCEALSERRLAVLVPLVSPVGDGLPHLKKPKLLRRGYRHGWKVRPHAGSATLHRKFRGAVSKRS
jgi:hypothetical protein